MLLVPAVNENLGAVFAAVGFSPSVVVFEAHFGERPVCLCRLVGVVERAGFRLADYGDFGRGFRLLYGVCEGGRDVLGGHGLFHRLHHVEVNDGIAARVCRENLLVVHRGLRLVCGEEVEGDDSGDHDDERDYELEARV